MAINGDISRISSQSVSDRRRLKIGRCLVTGRAIFCSGPNNTYIATLVERHTRYVMLAKVAGKDTQTVVTALIKQASASSRLPEAPKGAIQIPDLGPGQGTYGSSSLYVGDQNRRLFLRSAKPVATRVEREYQWPTETVLS